MSSSGTLNEAVEFKGGVTGAGAPAGAAFCADTRTEADFTAPPEEPVDMETGDLTDILPEDAELWEYKVVPFPSGSVNSIEALFNEYGKNGWEYVDTISRVVIFKRRLNY